MSDYYKDKTQRSIEQNREPRNVKNIYISDLSTLVFIGYLLPSLMTSVQSVKTHMVGGETHSCELSSAFYTCVMHGVHKHRIIK